MTTHLLSCKGMCSLQVPVGRVGAIALDSMMVFLEKMGEGIDEHRIRTQDDPDKTVKFERHCFDYGHRGRTVAFEEITVSWAEPWIGSLKFCTNERVPRRTRLLLNHVVTQNALSVMFQVDGPSIVLGPFFGRRSTLRDKLDEYLASISYGKSPLVSPIEVGKELWNIIATNGGLSALVEIWEDLFDQIKYQLLLKDPYCFD